MLRKPVLLYFGLRMKWCLSEVMLMETPEMEFLQYLLSRFIDMNDMDPDKVSVRELMNRLDEELTPIGGG